MNQFKDLTRKEQLELFEAWLDGEELEGSCDGELWGPYTPDLNENFYIRIKPKPLDKPSINWDHVHEDYNYLARDKSGDVWLYKKEPNQQKTQFMSNFEDMESANGFASLDPGTCDWKDSLIWRPR